jgi:hypothetical protein
MVGGIVLGVLAALVAINLNWPVATQVWIAVVAFLGGAAFEWLRVGAQKHAFAVLIVWLGWTGWYLSPDGTFRKVDWLAPVRSSAAAVEETAPAVPRVELPAAPSRNETGRAPTPRRAPTPAATAGGEHAQGAPPAGGYIIEVHNAEPQALVLTYTGGITPRSLGRIGPGETRHFTIEDTTLGTILLNATAPGGGARISVPVLLSANGPARVTLRRD